ncbi:hypothetical protein KKE34_04695 [Patescibacteria group bacterium]|nr:hypothetical protein [Patescibacteria group bacterium]
MNTLGNVSPPGNSSKKNQQAINPFARALSESEKGAYASDTQKTNSSSDVLSEALAKTGGQIPEKTSPDKLKKQEIELKKEHKKAELRQKLHDQINPIDQSEIFSGYKERTRKELEEVRKQLKHFAKAVTKFYKEVDIQTTQTVTDQGVEGIGLKAKFAKLKAFLILLTKQINSQTTWLQQSNVRKNQMKNRKIKGGMVMGKGKAQSKAVFDMMHHERSTAYSGG